jgi:hypothetical protein
MSGRMISAGARLASVSMFGVLETDLVNRAPRERRELVIAQVNRH